MHSDVLFQSLSPLRAKNLLLIFLFSKILLAWTFEIDCVCVRMYFPFFFLLSIIEACGYSHNLPTQKLDTLHNLKTPTIFCDVVCVCHCVGFKLKISTDAVYCKQSDWRIKSIGILFLWQKSTWISLFLLFIILKIYMKYSQIIFVYEAIIE